MPGSELGQELTYSYDHMTVLALCPSSVQIMSTETALQYCFLITLSHITFLFYCLPCDIWVTQFIKPKKSNTNKKSDYIYMNKDLWTKIPILLL